MYINFLIVSFKFLEFLRRNKKLLAVSLLLAFFGTTTIIFQSEKISDNLEKSVVRFHVLANSDSKIDQNLKIEVKDEIIKHMETVLKNSKDKSETLYILNNNKISLENIAKRIIKNKGFNYDVNVALKNTMFPTKVYGDISFPAGVYTALTVEIGEAFGENWWCVMYPPLCFVDITKTEVTPDMKIKLKDVLLENEFEMVYNENDKLIPNIKFKIVEIWQNLKARGIL